MNFIFDYNEHKMITLKQINYALSVQKNLHFKNIEIKNNKKGKPFIHINKPTNIYLKKKFKVNSFKSNL